MAPCSAVVLLSGGLDSATCLAVAKAAGYNCYALSFEYGQRHLVELKCAAMQAEIQGAEHVIVKLDLAAFGGSALTAANIPVPKAGESKEIPVTYVPARNTIMLSHALAFAEVRDASQIFIGVNAVDYSGYPDCRPEFILAFQRLANLATKAAVTGRPTAIKAPLLSMSKNEIIRLGLELGVDFALTSSCYDPSPLGEPCTQCDSCAIRSNAFKELGMLDPVLQKVRA